MAADDEAAGDWPVDPRRFAAALAEQRTMRLKGGLYHLNQVQMAYNTNRIEGSRLDEEQTRLIFETRTVDGPAAVDDVVETANHFRMFDRMLDGLGEPLTVGRIKEYHRLLKTGTSDADKEWFAVGEWKRVPNTVGGVPTTPPAAVAAAMDGLLARYPAGRPLGFADVCDFHAGFEAIHPFQDGNGRVGRLILFQQCLENALMPFIVLDEEKLFYYRGLSAYEDEPGFLRGTFRHFQDRYCETYGAYVP
ncbi:MAG: Fic family protein [Propionibacteriaceae bacterium]|jgi:Fic family protein|nr:Fic family protein [Propionibacteriaceae bacterium]